MSKEPAGSPPSKDSKPLRMLFPRGTTAKEMAEQINEMIRRVTQGPPPTKSP